MTTPITATILHNADFPALAASAQLSAVPVVLYGLSGYNSKASQQFIQLHDATSAPADGVAPTFNFTVPASSNYSVDFGVYGRNFTRGVYACNSSTADTKTIGAADTQFFARTGQQ